jgi:hypothetical protein
LTRDLQKAQPWRPADATSNINAIARGNVQLTYKEHAVMRLKERALTTGDALHVMKNGFVYESAQESTRKGCYKYSIECTTPNSNQRSLRVVVIPGIDPRILKIITVMWVDE